MSFKLHEEVDSSWYNPVGIYKIQDANVTSRFDEQSISTQAQFTAIKCNNFITKLLAILVVIFSLGYFNTVNIELEDTEGNVQSHFFLYDNDPNNLFEYLKKSIDHRIKNGPDRKIGPHPYTTLKNLCVQITPSNLGKISRCFYMSLNVQAVKPVKRLTTL